MMALLKSKIGFWEFDFMLSGIFCRSVSSPTQRRELFLVIIFSYFSLKVMLFYYFTRSGKGKNFSVFKDFGSADEDCFDFADHFVVVEG